MLTCARFRNTLSVVTKCLPVTHTLISSHYTKLDEAQEDTKEAKWLKENCYKYGFILRYPPEKTEITGIIYEPWHYRYVGVEDATKIMELGITLEEYLETYY